MTELDKDAARAFLKEFKQLMKLCGLSVRSRHENNRGLIDLGLNYKQRKEEIKSLNVLNYSSGPDPDHNYEGEVWIFGKRIKRIEVYIKLKIVESSGSSWPLCISFHPAAKPIIYPFVDNEDK